MSSPDASRATVERLLAEGEWVRRLARSLVSDPATADDVAQETWLAAVAHPPATVEHPRAWLGTVLRRSLAQLYRGGSRRTRRERESARPEGAPSSADLAARAEVHERLARAVLALEEPYRETILHRFFDDAPPREVARRMGVPVETVRTRTRRALERLRADLDPRDPDRRRALAAALSALAAAGRGSIASPAGLALAAGLAMAAGAVFVAVRLSDGGESGANASEVGGAARGAVLAANPRGNAGPAAPAPQAPAPAARRVLLVKDALDGGPVPGARVVVLPRPDGTGALEAGGGLDGRVEVALDGDVPRRVSVGAPDHVGARRWLALDIADPTTVFLAPQRGVGSRTIALVGRVTTARGDGVGGAAVRGVDPAGRELSTRTRADGAFAMTLPWDGAPGILVAERADVGRGVVRATPLGGDPYGDNPYGAVVLRVATTVDVPIRLTGVSAGTAARLRVVPLSASLHGGGPYDLQVSDGASVALPPGAWRASLSVGEERSPVVEGVSFLATADGLFALSVARDESGRADLYPIVGARLDALSFEVAPGAFRVRVLDATGAPVAGGRVEVEPSDVAQAHGSRYGEFGPSDPSWRNGLSGWDDWGRRAPLERLRTATADARGEAVVQGAIPAAALVRARGDFVPDVFHAVTEEEAKAGTCEVRVERGGSVEVEWPEWLGGAVLRRDDGTLRPVTAAEGPTAVAPGRYVLRAREIVWGGVVGKAAAPGEEPPPGAGSAEEIVLHGPFDVRAGERVKIDLRSSSPRIVATLAFLLDGTGPIACSNLWGTGAPRFVKDGRVSMPSVVGGPQRFRLAWNEDSAGTRVAHAHDVNVSTEGVAAGAERVFDLAYAPHSRRLVVENREAADVVVAVVAGREMAAPYGDQHHAVFLAPAGTETSVMIANLPAGAYSVSAAGPLHLAATPERFAVGEAGEEPLRVVLEDLHLEVRLLAPDGKPLPREEAQGLGVHLVPVGDAGGDRKRLFAEAHSGGAFYPRVPPGAWNVVVSDRYAMRRTAPRLETEVTLAAGVHEVSVTVPPR